MTPHLAIELIDLLEDHLPYTHASAIAPHLQVLIGLQFLAAGEYQHSIAQNWHHPVSQPTVSRVIQRFLNAMMAILDKFISFPRSRRTRQEMTQKFEDVCGYPGILGIIGKKILFYLRSISFLHMKQKKKLSALFCESIAFES